MLLDEKNIHETELYATLCITLILNSDKNFRIPIT